VAGAVEEKGAQRNVEPRLSPQLLELRERLRAGTHHGEHFEVSVTNSELEEAIAWYVERRPRIPFRNPQVFIHEYGIEAKGEARLSKMRLVVGGQAGVAVQDGLPVITVERLDLGKAGLPGFALSQVQAEVEKQLSLRQENLPVIVEGIELEESQLAVQGNIR
jgi:hypothetical protein